MELIQKLFARKRPRPPSSLPPEEGKESKDVLLAVGALTDKGCHLDHNEDALFAMNAALSQEEDLLPMGLYIVADGVGGQAAGAQASDLAVRLVADWVLDKLFHRFLLERGQTASHPPINQVLTDAAIAANGRIRQMCPDGGTTLTYAFVLGTNAFIAHVGDSRAYLISGNTIRQITTDHSLVNRLIELGQITSEEARVHPQRNYLYRAVGRAGNLEVDTYLQSLPARSSLLLCSDGLWTMVPERDILATVRGASSPQMACRRLVALANEKGGPDNITAVLVQIRN